MQDPVHPGTGWDPAEDVTRLPPLQSKPRRPHWGLALMRMASEEMAAAASAAAAAAAAMQRRCCIRRREKKTAPRGGIASRGGILPTRLQPLQSMPRRPHWGLALMRMASEATAAAAAEAAAEAAAMQRRCCSRRRVEKKTRPSRDPVQTTPRKSSEHRTHSNRLPIGPNLGAPTSVAPSASLFHDYFAQLYRTLSSMELSKFENKVSLRKRLSMNKTSLGQMNIFCIPNDSTPTSYV